MHLNERYRLDRYPLAHNGMGEVWTARDTRLDRPVIVKFLTITSDVDLTRRFAREARLTARLDHPGVPRVFDLGEHQGRPYLVLEKIDGVTLADVSAEQGPLPIAWVASIGAQIAAVLIAAHGIGLVHRDIKPSNAMLERGGAVKVLDFGLAAAIGDDRYSRITQTGQSLGTVGYMAPEQINAEPVDHRADLYGLGATLYHLLTGEAPFDGLTTMSTARRQLTERPAPAAALRQDIPDALDNLVQALLSIEPGHRPASATEVHAALVPLAGQRAPIPRVTDGSGDAVRAYAAAIAGQAQASAPPRPTTHAQDADEAARLLAAGEARAAARLWRRLAEQHGEDDARVVEWLRQAALAHVQLDEAGRALSQLGNLRARRVELAGPDDVMARRLQQDIDDLRTRRPTAG